MGFKLGFIVGGTVVGVLLFLAIFFPAQLVSTATIIGTTLYSVVTFNWISGAVLGGLIVAGVWAAKRYDLLRSRRITGKDKQAIDKELGTFGSGTVIRSNPQEQAVPLPIEEKKAV